MRDEMDDRMMQAGRTDLMAGLGTLLGGIMDAFRVLHRINWTMPGLCEEGCER